MEEKELNNEEKQIEETEALEEKPLEAELENVEEVPAKPLSRKEAKKAKKLEKKEAKKAKKLADKEFERNAGMTKEKGAALGTGLGGFIISLIPIALIVLVAIFAMICALATVFLVIFYFFGLIFVGIGYFIYASNNENPSLNGYFAQATAPFEFSKGLLEKVSNLSGPFLIVCAGVGLALEIVSLILVCKTSKSFTKKHKVRNFILVIFGLTVTAILLVVGILSTAGVIGQ